MAHWCTVARPMAHWYTGTPKGHFWRFFCEKVHYLPFSPFWPPRGPGGSKHTGSLWFNGAFFGPIFAIFALFRLFTENGTFSTFPTFDVENDNVYRYFRTFAKKCENFGSAATFCEMSVLGPPNPSFSLEETSILAPRRFSTFFRKNWKSGKRTFSTRQKHRPTQRFRVFSNAQKYFRENSGKTSEIPTRK